MQNDPQGPKDVIAVGKGQLISKCLFGIFNSPKTRTKFFWLYYYGTSSRFVFGFFGELKTPKRHFGINFAKVKNKIA